MLEAQVGREERARRQKHRQMRRDQELQFREY